MLALSSLMPSTVSKWRPRSESSILSNKKSQGERSDEYGGCSIVVVRFLGYRSAESTCCWPTSTTVFCESGPKAGTLCSRWSLLLPTYPGESIRFVTRPWFSICCSTLFWIVVHQGVAMSWLIIFWPNCICTPSSHLLWPLSKKYHPQHLSQASLCRFKYMSLFALPWECEAPRVVTPYSYGDHASKSYERLHGSLWHYQRQLTTFGGCPRLFCFPLSVRERACKLFAVALCAHYLSSNLSSSLKHSIKLYIAERLIIATLCTFRQTFQKLGLIFFIWQVFSNRC